MIDEDLERILQSELDGVATPEESKWLQERLAQSEETRARRRELEMVFHALAQVRQKDAPAELKEGVMAAIAAGHESAAVRPGRLETLKAALRAPHRLAWASPFLAGVVAGGLVIAIVSGILGPRVRTDLPVTGMLPPPERGALLDRQELRLENARVTFEARRVAGGVAVEFSPAVASPVELVLEFAPAALRPIGLEWGRPGGHRAELAPGRVWLRIAEDGQGTLLLAPAGAGDTPIGLTMRSAAGSAQGTLHTAAPGRGR